MNHTGGYNKDENRDGDGDGNSNQNYNTRPGLDDENNRRSRGIADSEWNGCESDGNHNDDSHHTSNNDQDHH